MTALAPPGGAASVVPPSPSDLDPGTRTTPVPGLPGARTADERLQWKDSAPFLLLQLTPLLILVTGVSWKAVALLAVTFWVRMFCITAGYHRYFSHRSYRLGRIPQAILAFGGTTAVQKGPLWWASHHRDHHRWSDTDRDVHSPLRGFWWSHMGWILCEKYGTTKWDRIKDFAKYPELRWLNKHDWVGPWALALACFLIAGWQGLVIGFFTSTVLLWHSTFFINSLSHVFGRRRYATEDTSRNSALLAVLTMGEGWHNNHHYHQSSVRQGFFWWEWDPTYYVLKAFSWVGIVKDMKAPPRAVLETNRIRDGVFDVGMFRAHLTRASFVEQVAKADAAGPDAVRTLTRGQQALSGAVDGAVAAAEDLARATRQAQRVQVVAADDGV